MEQISVDDDVDDVLTLAEGRGRGQPGEKVMNVIVQHAGHGPPSAPAADATRALRVAVERLSLASDVLANIDTNVCASVVVPARAGSACASLELEYAQHVADTPPSYAEVQGRVAPTVAATEFYQWTPTPLLGQQPAAPATTTTPTAAVVDVSPAQSMPTAPPTPDSPAVSPVSTVMPTEEADRLHAELREMERFLDLPQQSSLSMELPQTVTTTTTTPITTAAAPRPFLYPPPPATTTTPAAAVVDSPVQSTPTAPPTPGSPAVSPVSTVMPTEEADRLHAELREIERFMDLLQQPSLSMKLLQTVTTTPTTTAAAPRPFLYPPPPPPAAPTGRTGRHRLRATPPDSQACSSTSTLQSASEAELDFAAFEATRRRRRAYRPAPTQPMPASAAVANSLTSRSLSHRSDASAMSCRSVVVPSEVIGMVNRMTDSLLQVAHQS